MAMLVGWTLWIGVHAPLSHLLGFSAWKLGGMGMFADQGDWLDGSVYVAVVQAPGASEGDVLRAVGDRLRDDGFTHGAAMDAVYVERLDLAPSGLAAAPVPEDPAFEAAHEGVLLWPRATTVDALVTASGGSGPGWFVVRAVSGWDRGQVFEICAWGRDRVCAELRR
ncbi:MAG: hypothetical protein ABMB14_17865 [Myxococcota bacterium]